MGALPALFAGVVSDPTSPGVARRRGSPHPVRAQIAAILPAVRRCPPSRTCSPSRLPMRSTIGLIFGLFRTGQLLGVGLAGEVAFDLLAGLAVCSTRARSSVLVPAMPLASRLAFPVAGFSSRGIARRSPAPCLRRCPDRGGSSPSFSSRPLTPP